MKKAIIISLSAVAFLSASFFTFNALAKHIFNRIDCKRFNIDNIEVRTGVNVPEIDSFKCSCEDYIKQSSFILGSTLNLEEYIDKNAFQKIDGMYQKQNSNKYTKWKALLDKEKRELSFIIEYLDHKSKPRN